jgi:hypothetical protein
MVVRLFHSSVMGMVYSVNPANYVWTDDQQSGTGNAYTVTIQVNQMRFGNEKKKRIHKIKAIFETLYSDSVEADSGSYLWFAYGKEDWVPFTSLSKMRSISIPNSIYRYYVSNLGSCRSLGLALVSRNKMSMKLRTIELDVSTGGLMAEFLIRKPISSVVSDKATQARWFNSLWVYCRGSHGIAPVKTAAFTVDVLNQYYPCNTTSAGFTATLPPAAGLMGKPYWFKNVGSTNTLTISRAGTDLIDAAATLALTTGQAATLVSDGVNKWYQVSSLGSGGGGGTITVQEEGVTQSSTVTTLNFVGAAVTASGAGATETITVSALLPANNLSDVVNAVTSFDNPAIPDVRGNLSIKS